MIKTQKIRMIIDISMTILSIILMGGTVLFPNDKVHQILGMALLALWAVHIALNRKWYGAILKGKYNPYRFMQTVVNFGILLCAILLAVSGMMMAWFLPESVNVPLGFARTAHLVSSHWYYVFMSLHLGMHVGMIFSRIKAIAAKVLLTLVCVYGIYAFIVCGVGKYMFLRQQFFFLDLEKGYLLFALDYLSILVLIATASHWLGKALRAWNSGIAVPPAV